ncbi:hypothetical protein ELG63_36540 [Rhizobium leguminosarum]|uniref:hypothetical protein n=1 Tax=Rhizobium leguminosarum TaxID=384 RepID=UPI001032572A|nr:hypothetical protein [Rhizobium leguminosarum]TBH28199.1 hypothetical protein ELG63_36540 [Rhizobium leguminosarum]
MKLDLANHRFLLEVSLRLKTDMNEMLGMFLVTEQMLSDFRLLHEAFQGDQSVDQAMAQADVDDAKVVRDAYEKLSIAYTDAFTKVSNYHVSRAEAHEAQLLN